MIGHAVRERCPKCRMILGTTAVVPGQTVLRQIQCSSRACRAQPMLAFYIRDQRIQYLTREDLEALRLRPDEATPLP